jgi:hypothetical protein
MCAPYCKTYQPDPELRKKVAAYLATIVGRRRNEVASRLPVNMPLWEKMRICDGGDSITTAAAMRRRGDGPQRDRSYIRVSTNIFDLFTH